MKRLIGILLLALALPAQAQPPKQPDAAEIKLKLRKLSVLGSALYIAAHPDDENTALLAWLANGRLVRAGYLSVTRGDGGQNLIGDEKGELLGVIRTQELLAARRIDGAEQFFTRAVDFGYSKSPDETLQLWNKEKILADVVWVIRRFKPDVIITRFPTSGAGGHGQHTASSILAEEAFRAAADPTKFPEQLQLVEPWQPKRIFWNVFRQQSADVSKFTSVDLGSYSALLGKSFTELAGESRSMHKSQGFGSAERRGTLPNYLDLRDGEPATSDPFEGIDLSWNRIPGSDKVATLLSEAERAYDEEDPSKILPILLQAHSEMRKLPESFWAKQKRIELLEVIRACAGLWIEAIAVEPTATPGSETTVRVTILNRSSIPMTLEYVWLPYGRVENPTAVELKPNVPATQEIRVKIPDDAPLSQPYWLRAPHDGGSFQVAQQSLIGLAETPATFTFRPMIRIADEVVETFEAPTYFRWTDPVRGEQYRPFEIIPPALVNLQGSVFVFPDGKPKKIRAVVKSGKADVEGMARLNLPTGWKAEPETAPFKIAKKGDEVPLTFTVTPRKEEESVVMTAETKLSGGDWTSIGLITIDYPHIPMQTLLPSAAAKLVRVDIARTGQRIGYLPGSGDEIPNALRQVGYQVTTLTDDEIETGDLGRYDAIVLGVRAYNTRPRLAQQQGRLFDYVSNGGTLVTQYNTLEETLPSPLGPYPFKLSRDRVTVETAPVSFNDPDHPLLLTPNAISQKDFEGWVQERGLYFANEWDAKYQTVVASHDPGETPKPGGLLYARHGEGVFIYTSYAFFRQLPAGVPGAYRLFTNLVSAK